MKQRLRTLQYIAALSCIALSGACRQDLIVNMGQGDKPENKLCKQSIRVDIVAVNEESERELWENMSMSDYWNPGNAQSLRNSVLTHTMRWGGEQQPCTQILDGKDGIWEKWKGRNSDWLFILADTPGKKDRPDDPRRLSFPLDKKYPKKGFLVTETGIIDLTPK